MRPHRCLTKALIACHASFAMVLQLKEDIHDANQRHESENMRFEDQVYLEIDLVKKAIDTEVDERARSEESIVNSLGAPKLICRSLFLPSVCSHVTVALFTYLRAKNLTSSG